MNHMIALQVMQAVHGTHVVPAPGAFKVFGYKIPTVLGQLFHDIAVYFKYIAVVIVILLLWLKGKVEPWKELFLIVIGMVAIPSWSPRVSHYTSDITSGSAVGSTKASAGMVIFLLVILLFTIYRMLIRPPVREEEVVEQK